MSILNTSAGHSSMCLREEHSFCAAAGARCTCTCHGSRGQSARIKERFMSVTSLTTSPDSKARCDVCGESFVSAHGVQVHKARRHQTGIANNAKPSPAPKPVPATKPKPAADPWIVICPDSRGIEHVRLSTAEDAKKVAELIDGLGHEVFAFRLADGKTR